MWFATALSLLILVGLAILLWRVEVCGCKRESYTSCSDVCHLNSGRTRDICVASCKFNVKHYDWCKHLCSKFQDTKKRTNCMGCCFCMTSCQARARALGKDPKQCLVDCPQGCGIN